MHELGRPGRRPARQIIHFTQENGIAPARRVARDAAAVDAAPNDCEVENPIQRRFPGARLFTLAILLSVWIKSQPNVKATEKGELGNSSARSCFETRPSGQARHARPCAGHPRLTALKSRKTWMAGTSPAMTKKLVVHDLKIFTASASRSQQAPPPLHRHRLPPSAAPRSPGCLWYGKCRPAWPAARRRSQRYGSG